MSDFFQKDLPNFVTHLECGLAGDHYPAGQVHNLSKALRPLLVRYDLEKLARSITKEELAKRPAEFWRYREFLPVPITRTSYGWAKLSLLFWICPNSSREKALCL